MLRAIAASTFTALASTLLTHNGIELADVVTCAALLTVCSIATIAESDLSVSMADFAAVGQDVCKCA